MRLTSVHLDDIDSRPEGTDLALDQVAEPWRSICDDFFALTAGEAWDDAVLPIAAGQIYGLPAPEQMPRPGQVAGWTHREWIGWATGHGFEEVPRSKHAYQYRHRLAPWVLLSMSSSPGDHRWSMATATDLRFSIDAARKRLGANLHVATLVVSTAVERHPSSAARERLVTLKHFLLETTERDAALLLVANHGDVAWEQFDRVAYDANSVAEVRVLFQALQSEFGLGAKAALRRTGIDQVDAALIAKRLSSTTVSDLLPGDLLPALGDLLDRLREEQAHAQRAKEQQRAAREEPAAAPAPASIELPEIRAVRHELRLKLEQLRVRTATALQDIDRAIAEVSAALEETALPNAEELERLRSENKALRAVIERHQLKPIAD